MLQEGSTIYREHATYNQFTPQLFVFHQVGHIVKNGGIGVYKIKDRDRSWSSNSVTVATRVFIGFMLLFCKISAGRKVESNGEEIGRMCAEAMPVYSKLK